MKRLLIVTLAAMATVGVRAELLDPSAALQRAMEQIPSASVRRAVRGAALAPMKTVALHSTEAELYVFDAQNSLMLVSAESETPALLGYSENYEQGQPLPPALEMMIESYAAEIAAARSGNVVKAASSAGSRADFAAIAPICKTTWNQEAPYNNLTPTLNGKATVTGCVATAIAQILKTYEYPQKGSGGVYSYYWKNGGKYISLDFDKVTFDWANMLNSYAANGSNPEVNKTAVATLMEACGYAADMNYSTDASGATGNTLARGLVRNLGYDPTLQYLERRYFSLADWNEKVYGELAAGHPVYYDGITLSNEGHAFVVDGYRSEGFFHLNWGWGGLADGYFLLTALDPGSQGIGGASSGAGFDLLQGAIFGLKPASGIEESKVPLLFFSQGAFAINTRSITSGSSVSVSYTCYNGGNFAVTTVSPALCFTSAGGVKYYSKSAAVSGSVSPMNGFNFGSVPTPSGLPEGDYTVTAAVYSGVTNHYYGVYGPLGLGQSVLASVSGNRITFQGTVLPELWAASVAAPESVTARREFPVSLTIENSSAAPFSGALYLALCETGKTVIKAYISTFVANVDGNSAEELTVAAEVQNLALPAGTYDMYVLDSNRNAISNAVEISLEVPEDLGVLTASKLTMLSQTTDDVSVSVTLAAKDGNYKGRVWLQLHNRGDYNNYVARYPVDLTLKNGGSTVVTLGGAFPEGIAGYYYTAYIYYTHEGVDTECSGRQRKTFQLEEGSAIEEITADSGLTTKVYDLTGRKVLAPVRGQLYITDKGQKIFY